MRSERRIEVGGGMRFISKQMYGVLTRGNPMTGVEIIVEPVG